MIGRSFMNPSLKQLRRCLAARWLVVVVTLGEYWIAAAAEPVGRAASPAAERTFAVRSARYLLDSSIEPKPTSVREFTMVWCPAEERDGAQSIWLALEATKQNDEQYRVWLLTSGDSSATSNIAGQNPARFIFQQGRSEPVEFRNRFTGKAVLPSLGGWLHLIPRAEHAEDKDLFPDRSRYLGHTYRRAELPVSRDQFTLPDPRVISLSPDALIGMPSNTRQKDSTRRYDTSDYEYIRLTRQDVADMAKAGINCFRIDREQLDWIKDLPVFYWGVGGKDVPFPECLYDSRYLGPALFLDEPAVSTRDHVIRPRLAKDETFRRSITPETALDLFREYFRHVLDEGAATSFLKGLASRNDVDLGGMRFAQANLYSWETMVSTAGWQLSQDPLVPAAVVFEPPGRVGTRRTLPEMNMTYGCQIPVDDPRNFTAIIYGFLRGAARLTGKSWGTSIYGAVDRSDAPWFLTHAYDLGATRFFFWDNAQLACVPYEECLALAKALSMRIENHPRRDLEALKRAAEVVILFPPGYNLGHVHLGKGSLWGVGELNLDRRNSKGVTYRQVMSAVFIEIERCLRHGVAFDLLWDLPKNQPSGYRELVRIRDDAKVEVIESGRLLLLDGPRIPSRPPGESPQLRIELSGNQSQAPAHFTARAFVHETTAPVYYTYGTDTSGAYHNAAVAWELYGPGEQDYRVLTPDGLKPRVTSREREHVVVVEFKVERPGSYRLRAATVDMAGRTTVQWIPIQLGE